MPQETIAKDEVRGRCRIKIELTPEMVAAGAACFLEAQKMWPMPSAPTFADVLAAAGIDLRVQKPIKRGILRPRKSEPLPVDRRVFLPPNDAPDVYGNAIPMIVRLMIAADIASVSAKEVETRAEDDAEWLRAIRTRFPGTTTHAKIVNFFREYDDVRFHGESGVVYRGRIVGDRPKQYALEEINWPPPDREKEEAEAETETTEP